MTRRLSNSALIAVLVATASAIAASSVAWAEPAHDDTKGVVALLAQNIAAADRESGASDLAARVSPVLDPVRLTPSGLNHIVELRSALGLAAGPDFVKELHRAPRQHDVVDIDTAELAGLLVTREEVESLALRNRLQAVNTELQNYFSNESSGHYAGGFLDSGTGGVHRVVVKQTGDSNDSTLLVRDVVPDDLEPLVEIQHAELSLEELVAIQSDVVAAIRSRGHDRSIATNIDIDDGKIDVLVDVAADESTRQAIEAAVTEIGKKANDENIIRLGTHGVGSGDYGKADYLPGGLVEGGLRLDGGGQFCTSAFAMQNGYGTFIITAGHCFAIGWGINQGGAYAGGITAQSCGWLQYRPVYPGCGGAAPYFSFDAAALHTQGVRGQIGAVHITRADYAHPFATYNYWSPQSSIRYDAQGNVVCQTGYTSGSYSDFNSTTCGVSISNFINCTGGGLGVLASCYTSANYYREGGDSGAAVYNPYGGDVRGVGVHSGHDFINGQDVAIYSDIGVIKYYWQLNPT